MALPITRRGVALCGFRPLVMPRRVGYATPFDPQRPGDRDRRLNRPVVSSNLDGRLWARQLVPLPALGAPDVTAPCGIELVLLVL